ncbi:MAG: type IA DNA topoisomerase [Lachnospiraceae bacterium]|nr:type IA DNA topoisomerase [Lachnospiraceae bacterium]
MAKKIIITEKPSVARSFAEALGESFKSHDGYLESDNYIVTWCVGHLVTMCYPEVYDASLKRWSMNTIPFIPTEYKYQVIDNVKKQFGIVKKLFHRDDVDVIYNAGDSGREGEYIQRLVRQEAGFRDGIQWKRVWIDSQTKEEILRGINEAVDMSEYDHLSDAAYLRAQEDYLMGINFSRALTLKYGDALKDFLGLERGVIAVGRVMTCVLGMVVNREREIRNFVKTPFYKISREIGDGEVAFNSEWKVTEDSAYKDHPRLYKDIGFKEKEDADSFAGYIEPYSEALVANIDKKKQKKAPPLLYNLAELQNECSKLFKISPDETLKIAQELYEKKLTTYPRTDARVLSSAVAKEITGNIRGLKNIKSVADIADEILEKGLYKGLASTKYVNDKQITDHYAIIPTGQGIAALSGLSSVSVKVYEVIVRRFLAIFYPAAVYNKVKVEVKVEKESFFSNFTTLQEEGYLKVMNYSFGKKNKDTSGDKEPSNQEKKEGEGDIEQSADGRLLELINSLRKGVVLKAGRVDIREGETTPPKRYNSGSIILAMENAGQLIEDEDLRAQIKGSGIGTSATRAEILKKLFTNRYLSLNHKTQIITPTITGELIYEIVGISIKALLDPKLTASWEKGLTGVAGGEISKAEYSEKLNAFVIRRTDFVKHQNTSRSDLYSRFSAVKANYPKA